MDVLQDHGPLHLHRSLEERVTAKCLAELEMIRDNTMFEMKMADPHSIPSLSGNFGRNIIALPSWSPTMSKMSYKSARQLGLGALSGFILVSPDSAGDFDDVPRSGASEWSTTMRRMVFRKGAGKGGIITLHNHVQPMVKPFFSGGPPSGPVLTLSLLFEDYYVDDQINIWSYYTRDNQPLCQMFWNPEFV